jgi:hypothetical protein
VALLVARELGERRVPAGRRLPGPQQPLSLNAFSARQSRPARRIMRDVARLPGVAAILLAAAAAGCARQSFGPRTIPYARHDYNEAISRSWDEDLLLNLVRLHYRDSPLFVDITSVTASYTLQKSASLAATTNSKRFTLGDVTANAGLTFSETPVIAYSYLNGEAFAQRLLTPLGASTLEQLSSSGWSLARLMLCCVQSVNGVENAIAAAGPTPDYVPDYERFQRLASLMRTLQVARKLAIESPNGKETLYLAKDAGPEGTEVRSLLKLDPAAEQFTLVAGRTAASPTQIAVQARSLLAVMAFLSQGVDVPEAHRTAGKVTLTRDASGAPFDWQRVTGPLIHVHAGAECPPDPAVCVPLRGAHFWIADDDLNSKTTFSLLRLLLFLKSGDRETQQPVVTIPAR